jgi:hypothetical protein
LTPTLRPIDAGIAALGVIEQAPNLILPPGEPDFHFYAHFDNCLVLGKQNPFWLALVLCCDGKQF